MNREALRRVLLARAAGWSYGQLADLYDRMKQQIEASVPGWRADRAKCVDGSHIFIGSKGPTLAIMPTCRIFVGRFAPDGLVRWQPLQRLPDGSFAFPAPEIHALGTTEVT